MRAPKLAGRALRFAQRQTHNFKLMLGRRALHSIASSLSIQYDSIYASLLGADPVQLGSLQSVGNAVGALVTLPVGWFIDYHNVKSIFLLGTATLAAYGLLYFVAPHWAWLYLAVILYYLGMRITCTSCTVTCATELANEERATGRGFCQAIGSALGLATPLLAAWLISQFGGLNLDGIRPLYGIQTLIFGAIFVLLLTKLPRSEIHDTSGHPHGLLSSFKQVFGHGPDVVRLMLVIGLMEIPWSLVQPFAPLYAHQFKGANEFVLGGIAVARTLVPMLASVPLGRLADKKGRKKLLLAIAPLAYAGNLCLVLAPASGSGSLWVLLLFGLLFGFNSVSMTLVSSMAAEIMPPEQMGRWIGVVSLLRGLLAIPAPMLGGLIWEHLGPQHVFLSAIAIDAGLRLPLLAAIRETLHLSVE